MIIQSRVEGSMASRVGSDNSLSSAERRSTLSFRRSLESMGAPTSRTRHFQTLAFGGDDPEILQAARHLASAASHSKQEIYALVHALKLSSILLRKPLARSGRDVGRTRSARRPAPAQRAL